MFKFVLLLLAFAVVATASTPSAKSVSASIKDTSVEGLEGLNLNIGFPFKFDEYIVGFKHSFGALNKAPETLFVKRSVKTGDSGVATIDADYNTRNNVFSIASQWVSDKMGLTVSMDANSRDKVTEVGLKTNQSVNGNKVGVNAAYNVAAQTINVETSVAHDDTVVKLSYDTGDRNPELRVSQQLNKNNEINPSINLKTGAVKYGWTRRYTGGTIESTLNPADRVVEVDWEDNGSNGAWKTRANIPIEDLKKTKVSVSRDWNV